MDILRESLMPLAERMRAAFVFGSAARGELHASSDVDLLVIGDLSFGDVITALRAMPPVELPGMWPNKVQAVASVERVCSTTVRGR